MFVRLNLLFFSEPHEVSKHEWYHVVTNCLGHVFIPSLFTKSSRKLSKKGPKSLNKLFLDFSVNSKTGNESNFENVDKYKTDS